MLWEKLTLARMKKGLSKKELANLVGVVPIQITRIELGQQMPKADTIVKIAIVLEISTDEILEGLREEIEKKMMEKENPLLH